MADIKRIIQILINSKYDGKGVRDAASDLGSLVGVVGSIGKGLATGGAAVLSTLGAITLASSAAADQMRDLSIRTGIQVDTLSGLGYAAKQSGTNVEELAGGLRVLVREADAAASGSEEAQAKFLRLGISSDRVAQLLKSPKDLLLAVADGLQRVEAGGARSAATLDLFGRSGDRLTELMAGGAAGIRALTDEAERLGVILEPEAADRADRFQDSLNRARSAGGALGQSISTALLPKLTQLADELAEAIAKTKEWVDQNPELVEGLAKVAVTATGAGLALGTVANVATAISGLKDLPAVLRGAGTALRSIASSGVVVPLLVIAAALTAVSTAAKSISNFAIDDDVRREVIRRAETDPRTSRDVALLNRGAPTTPAHEAEAIAAAKRLGENLKKIEEEVREERRKTSREAEAAIERTNQVLRRAYEERKALEARAASTGLSIEEQKRLEELNREIQKLSLELDRMKAPEALKQLRVELALARQSAGDLEFLRGVAKQQFESTGQVAAEILRVLDLSREGVDRLRESIEGIPGRGPRLGRRESETGFTPDIPIPDDPLDTREGGLLDRPLTESEERVAELQDSLANLEDVGVSATSEIAGGLGNIIYNLVTGQEQTITLGGVLKTAFAGATAAIAASVAQLVLMNTLLGIFTGGPFSPFKGIGKLFGGAAEGGIIRGGIPGRDSVPILAQQGELITPAPLTAKLDSFLDRYFTQGGAPPAATSRRTEVHVHTGIFAGTRAELQDVARRLQDSERELDLGTAY